jgi:glucose dehydrogenase
VRGFAPGLLALGVATCRNNPPGDRSELLLPPPATAVDPARRVEWPVTGGDPAALHRSPLTDIDTATVGTLAPAWTWWTGEREHRVSSGRAGVWPGAFEATPVMVRDTLYVSTPFNRVAALDANTGRRLWLFDPRADTMPLLGNRRGWVHRGVALWSGDGARRVFMTTRWRLIALDARTGVPVPGFGKGGEVDLTRDLRWPVDPRQLANTSPPLVVGDLVIVGSAVADQITFPRDPPGDVQAFDARTGRRVWRWDPVPGPGEPGRETWAGGSADSTGHANVWSMMSADTARGLVYLPVSAASNDWYGGARGGDDLFAESLVCLDARTGHRVWHAQLVHHGLWDYDLPAAPSLVRFPRGRDSVDAVIVAGKTGFLYAFDRVTGAPLWPLEERPAPASDVPGEQAAPTQPVPAGPPPFARQGFSEADAVDFTPEIHRLALARLAGYRLGPLFTPPSLRGTAVLPGWLGGAGWGGGAWDVGSGLYFVKATNRPSLGRLVPLGGTDPLRRGRYALDNRTDPSTALLLDVPVWPGFLARFGPTRKIPINRPPWGTLTAIDLAARTIRWQVTLGDSPEVRSHPKLRGVALPPLGVAGAPGGIVTAGGLIFISGGGRVLYAIERTAGRVLWQADLGAEAYANPMTYRTALGRQFVVIAVGEGDGARLRAFALPPSPTARERP